MTTSIITPTTELEAVNILFDAIGESPVSSLEDAEVVDAGRAQQTLFTVSREVQTRGYVWNTDRNKKVLVNSEGEIILAQNVLRIDTVGKSKSMDVVQRGQRLYNPVEHTYTFTEPLYVDMVVGLPFDELTEAARQWITHLASQRFQATTLGSQVQDSFLRDDIVRARRTLAREETKVGDHNILTGSMATYSAIGNRNNRLRSR